MNVPFYIAKRYLFAKRSRSVVHIISYVSMLGVAVGTASLIIVLSVFNGFENLVLSLYNAFDPAIKITAAEGKVFKADSAKLVLDKHALLYSEVLEEKVLLKYKNKEYIATLKGVDEQFKKINNVDSMLLTGTYFDGYASEKTAILGQGVAYHLSIGVGDIMNPLQLFVPKREKRYLLNASDAFSQSSLIPVGIFGIQADFDATYVITSLNNVQKVLERSNVLSALEVYCKDSEMEALQEELQTALGSAYIVQNRYQQHAFLYQILNSEKMAVFLILTFILIIATFNIIGSLSMLIIDKKKDIQVLSFMGLNNSQLQQLFWIEGLLTTLVGAIVGLFIGLIFCWAQIKWGFITMGAGSFVIDQYPVSIQSKDLAIVALIVLSIGAVAAWIPALQLKKNL